MGKKKDISDLLVTLSNNGIGFDNSVGHSYLKIAYNHEWDKDSELLFKYSIAPNNGSSLCFTWHKGRESNVSDIFFYDWVTILNIQEPDKREYSIHILKDEKDCYANLDYIVVRNS